MKNIIDIAKALATPEAKRTLLNCWGKTPRQDSLDAMSSRRWTAQDFDIRPKTAKDLGDKLGRRWKAWLSNLRSFVELYQYMTSKKRVTEIGIPQTKAQLLELFRSQPQVCRVIKAGIKCGLLVRVCDDYRYGKDGETYPMRYIYSKPVERLIKDTVEDLGLEWDRYSKRHGPSDTSLSDQVPERTKEKIRVGAGLRLDKRLTDDQIRAVLDLRYPEAVRCRATADEDNRNLPAIEQISCEWKIGRGLSGVVTKIGFRATSGIVSFKSVKKAKAAAKAEGRVFDRLTDRYSGTWREDYLDEVFGAGKWCEFDVKSSIFRVTYFLNNGVWLDGDIDLYALMLGRKFRDESERAAYKAYAMRPYFDSGRRVAGHIWPALRKTATTKDELRDAVEADRSRVEAVIGRSRGSEVFVDESCIYMELAHRVRQRGYRVVQVYDGFYGKAGEGFEEACAEELGKTVRWYMGRYAGEGKFGGIGVVDEGRWMEVNCREREKMDGLEQSEDGDDGDIDSGSDIEIENENSDIDIEGDIDIQNRMTEDLYAIDISIRLGSDDAETADFIANDALRQTFRRYAI